jgi:hypothetical protein
MYRLSVVLAAAIALGACQQAPTAVSNRGDSPVVIGPSYSDTIAFRQQQEADYHAAHHMRPMDPEAYFAMAAMCVPNPCPGDAYPNAPSCPANITVIYQLFTQNPKYIGSDVLPGEDWLHRIERGEIYSRDPGNLNQICRNWNLAFSWSWNVLAYPFITIDYSSDRQTVVLKHRTGNGDNGELWGANGNFRDVSYWDAHGWN